MEGRGCATHQGSGPRDGSSHAAAAGGRAGKSRGEAHLLPLTCPFVQCRGSQGPVLCGRGLHDLGTVSCLPHCVLGSQPLGLPLPDLPG